MSSKSINLKKVLIACCSVSLAALILCLSLFLSDSSGVDTANTDDNNKSSQYEEETFVDVTAKHLNKNISWPVDRILPKFAEPAEELDFIDSTKLPPDEQIIVTALKGIVNSEKPRIYSYDGNGSNKYVWLDELNLKYKETNNVFELVKKYISEIKGMIIYDPRNPHTLNLATTLAGIKKAIIVKPATISKLESAGINLEVVEDFQGRFEVNKPEAIYQYLYDNYWNEVTHKVLIGINPDILGYIREYCIGINAACIWLNSKEPDEAEILDKLFSDMPAANSVYMGWWGDEGAGVRAGSKHGVPTVAADFISNLTVLGGLDTELNPPVPPPKPELKNKVYVAILLSDGDNLQFMQHMIRQKWDNKARGEYPITWTVPPLIADCAPAMMNWYFKTATANDCFIAGPSGLAYTYTLDWENRDDLNKWFRRTDEYCTKIGARIATVWNDGDFFDKPPFDEAMINYVTNNLPNMLGVTQQVKGASVFRNDVLIHSLSVPYTWDAKFDKMEDAIQLAYLSFLQGKRNEPKFVAIQGNAGINSPTHLKKIFEYGENLSEDIEFVRLDHLFMLEREYMGHSPDKVKVTNENTNNTSTNVDKKDAGLSGIEIAFISILGVIVVVSALGFFTTGRKKEN